MSACFHRIAATGRWVQSKDKPFVEQSIITRLRVATLISGQNAKYQPISDILFSVEIIRGNPIRRPFLIKKRYHNESYALILTESLQYMKSGLRAWMLEKSQVLELKRSLC
jgi:hypothetical protein